MLDTDSTPAPDVLSALPIFPLPNVVFLPGMVLPLNVFEPRYLELVDHVLEGGMHVGVPLLRSPEMPIEPDDDSPVHDPGDERPAIEGVFGLGKMIAHRRMPDGRRLIRLEGLGRVRVVDELPQRSYAFRRVVVEPLPEPGPLDLHALEVLKAQVERVAETFDEDDRHMIHSVLELDDCRVTVYAIASLVPNVEILRALRRGHNPAGSLGPLRVQQRCLAAADADSRVALLCDRASALIELLEQSGSFPVNVLN